MPSLSTHNAWQQLVFYWPSQHQANVFLSRLCTAYLLCFDILRSVFFVCSRRDGRIGWRRHFSPLQTSGNVRINTHFLHTEQRGGSMWVRREATRMRYLSDQVERVLQPIMEAIAHPYTFIFSGSTVKYWHHTEEDVRNKYYYILGWEPIYLTFVDPCIIVKFIKKNPTRCNDVSKLYFFIFIWSSSCFGRHTAHHQEPKTALEASGFSYVEGCLGV